MSKFCETCNNLLTPNIIHNSLSFRCQICSRKFDSTDEDTLRYEETKGSSLHKYTQLLQNAFNDPMILKVYKQCVKCKHNIVKQSRIPVVMKLINTCTNPKCKHQWIEK